MKILRPGDTSHRWTGNWICEECGCAWLMEEHDTEPKLNHDWRDGDYYYMPCPNCKRRVTRAVPRPLNTER